LNLGEEVPRGFLEVLDGKSDSIPSSDSGRLQLANWLTENPVAVRLTSRVIVNRLWHWHFGGGLVSTPDDFGVRGQPPSHPRLLDFLALRLMDQQWSLKAMHRIIVTSETFKMSADTRDARAVRIDLTNRLHAKHNRTRLDAESIRDALLFHAGDLDMALGHSPMNVKSQDPSPEDMQQNLEVYEESRRRSVYLPIVRSNVYDFLTLFDFPNASTPVGNRGETTIPTQALWLMNSPFMVKHARAIAQSRRHAGGDRDAILGLYLRLYSRQATEGEMASGQRFLNRIRATLPHDNPSPELAAWTMYCQVLLASNEFIYLN
jgi:hypothetical protein